MGGDYDYVAAVLDPAATLFRGTLQLQDGQDGTFGGSYRLPNDCRRPDGTLVDCVGFVHGSLDATRQVQFDFDTPQFRNAGLVDRDGVLRGLWTVTLPPDSSGVARTITGRFTATPRR